METWLKQELLPVREKAYRYLKNQILEGHFQAGERLIERELAEKMKISRTPIREALLRLESQGLVQTIPRRGVIVKTISTEDVIELFAILSTLEGLAVVNATEKIDATTKAECNYWIETLESSFHEQDVDYTEMHMNVSHFLYKAAKSPKLYEMLVDLMDYIRAFASIGRRKEGREQEAMREHLDILKAVRDKQVELAKSLTIVHIERSKAAYINSLKQ